MNAGSLTREQRMLGAAGALVIFIIGLFLNWYGSDIEGIDASISGFDAVPSGWILLIFAIVAAGLLAAEALRIDLPIPVGRPSSVATFLTSVCFIITLMFMLEGPGVGGGRKIGLFLAFIFALIAFVLCVWTWREES